MVVGEVFCRKLWVEIEEGKGGEWATRRDDKELKKNVKGKEVNQVSLHLLLGVHWVHNTGKVGDCLLTRNQPNPDSQAPTDMGTLLRVLGKWGTGATIPEGGNGNKRAKNLEKKKGEKKLGEQE